MVFQIPFSYIICLVVLTQPTATAAVQSDAYAAIFSATSPSGFVSAMDKYLNQTFFNSNYQTNYVVKESQLPVNNRTLLGNYSITQQYTGSSSTNKATKIEFLIVLGTGYASTFRVRVFQGTTQVQSTLVTVSNSNVWNTLQLTQPLTGTISVNITGVTTHLGDHIPTFSNTNMIVQNPPWSIASSSQYYYSYNYTTYVTVTQKVYDPIEHQYYYIQVQKPETATGWKTDTISENPAIRIENMDYLTSTYQVGPVVNGHYSIYKYGYKNHVNISSTLKGYADYPTMEGYKIEIAGVSPNFATDGVPLDQLLGEFMQDEGLVSTTLNLSAYLNLLYTFLQDPANESSTIWQWVANNFTQLMYSINGPYDNTHPTKYVFSDYWPQGGVGGHYMGLYKQIWSIVPLCLEYTNVQDPITGIVSRVCVQYSTTDTQIQLNSSELLGQLGLASQVGAPSSLDNIVLLKTPEMLTYPAEPYFFSWLANLDQTVKGTQFNQTLLSAIAASTPINPVTITKAKFINPYEAQVNITNTAGIPTIGTVPVIVKDQQGNALGTGSIINGTGYVSATTGQEFGPNDVVVAGNAFYMSSQAVGSITQLATTTNVSLVLDPNQPTGTNPYVADVTVTDSQGNTAMGPLPVTVWNGNTQIATGTAYNGTAHIVLPDYYPSAAAVVNTNPFYGASASSGSAQYDLVGMMQTQGPAGSDPVTNAKYTIIRNYIEKSGAFDYNSLTGNYTMNAKDECNLFNQGGPSAGYCILDFPTFSQQELAGNRFDNTTIPIQQFHVQGSGVSITIIPMSKMQFFDLWLGMKMAPYYTGNNPPDPSSYTGFDVLAGNFSTLLHEPQSYFQQGGSTEQHFVAEVQGGLNATIHQGFPQPVSTSWWQGLIDLANTLIGAFINVITAVWNTICNIIGGIVNFVMGVWNDIVGPVIGAAIEAVKNVVNVLFNQILNTVVQPMLSGQTTSLNDLFGGESPNTIAANGQSVVSNLGSALDSQSSQLAIVGSSIQTLMSAGNVFSGAGTILAPLIEMTGPGIISTLFQLIGNIVLNSLITPLFSQFISSDLETDLTTLYSPLGGADNATLFAVNMTRLASTITSTSGEASKQYGNGYTTQTTGTNYNPGGSTFQINDLQSVSNVQIDSSPTLSSDALSTILQDLFQYSTSIAQTLMNNVFATPFIRIIEIALTGLRVIINNPTYERIIFMGLLSAFNDLLGALKTEFSNSVYQTIIQWIRLTIDVVQFLYSAYQLPTTGNELYNGLVDTFWFIKSAASLVSDSMSLTNDVAKTDSAFQQSLFLPLGDFGVTNGETLEALTLVGRIVLSGAAAAIILLNYLVKDIIGPKLNWTKSLTFSQLALITVFTISYVFESLAKIILYYTKFMDSGNVKLEQGIYLSSSVLDVLQMEATVFGFIPS